MYPITKQLIQYHCDDMKKIGIFILDVKGNYHKIVKEYTKLYGREKDLSIIELNSTFKYNPLDKPNLKPSVLANRLKIILTLLSPNNPESYWLDKAEQILCECIKLCRIYNNGYVTFEEIHKLVMIPHYFHDKLKEVQKIFQSGTLCDSEIYELLTCINFFEDEFQSLDSRVVSILKSEISRITSVFISDFEIMNTFCPASKDITFHGFDDLIDNGKIVVLNMNISEYKNLSKIIATYLKLDFQSEVLSRISKNTTKPSVFICDEFHEYVTSSDADFFAQSREAKCINIVCTQSYTSLINSLKDTSSAKVIIQNLINKIWFRTDDLFTIEETQKQFGKTEKNIISKGISENSKNTNYNYFFNSFKSIDSNLSENITSYTTFDYVYDTNFFTQTLKNFSALTFLSDGNEIFFHGPLKFTPFFQADNFLSKFAPFL